MTPARAGAPEEERERERGREREEGRENESGRPGGRLLAEWVTLAASVLLLAGIAGFLVVESFRPRDDFAAVEARPLADQARRRGDGYILPVQVVNRGSTALAQVEIELSQAAGGAPEVTQEAILQYLGERSSRRVYFYVKWDPRERPVRVRPGYYRVE